MLNVVNQLIDHYAEEHTQHEPQLLLDLVEESQQKMNYAGKMSGRQVGRLLMMLAKLTNAKNALELGMFTGYSALNIAEGMAEDGKLITCETNPQAVELAKRYFAQSPYGHKIDIRFGFAKKTLEELKPGFDFVFIDADKRGYMDYYETCLEKTVSGGLIIIDNVLWQGHVLEPRDAKDQVIVDLNTHIKNDHRVENVLLTVTDGINLVRKK